MQAERAESVNPYQVTSSGEELEYPIYFAGTLTRDDLRMSLYDAPPKRGLARIRSPLISMAMFFVVPAALLMFQAAGEPIPAIIWPFVGFVGLPFWFAVVRLLSPSHRKRVRRIEVMAENQTPLVGWFEEDRLVIHDGETAFRARWDYFSAAFLFPTHLAIPLSVDANHRVVVPFRFFSSPADVRHAIQFLSVKLGTVTNQPPSDPQLAAIDFSDAAFGVAGMADQARHWTRDRWPFGSDQDERFDWKVDLTGEAASLWYATRAGLAVIAIMLWYCFPIWATVAAWLIADYQFFGDWDFLHERVGSTALVLGPAAAVIAIFAYAAFRSALQIWRLQSQPMEIQLRTSGLQMSHAIFDVWMTWNAVHSVNTSDHTAGWVIKESMDEIQYPRACFDSQEGFESFKATLRRLAP